MGDSEKQDAESKESPEKSIPPPPGSSSGDKDEPKLSDLLEQCATNLTVKAGTGDLPKTYERDQEVEQILLALASPLKGRIVVTGDARVGKTAVIHEAAARIHAGDCPEALKGSEVWGLSARSILRAFGVGGWQEKLGRLMEMWSDRTDIILYVDALPTTRAAGATMEDPFDMAQFLLGQLQSSNSRILAEGRTQAVHGFLDSYVEFKHILLEVKINEPPVEVARKMIQQSARDLEVSQEITIDPAAIEVALDLTKRFSLHESLPGKTIDLIGEGIALSAERHEKESCVGPEDIIQRYGEKTGLPRILLTDDEPYDEQVVRRYFSDRVLGQEQAVEIVVRTLSLLRTRLNNPRRPMGVYLFIGPTGVGKTELARALSEFFFGSDEHIVRFNMADYTQDWDVGTLFGSAHGFDLESRRGQLTMRLQDHAFAVILLDEFEKAHPEVFQRFLQLFDEGLLLNLASETVNLRNTIVIMTSNFGSRMMASGKLGFGPEVSPEEQEEQIREEMVRFFTPEFINRIDSISFFKLLTQPVLREIAYRRVQEVLQREGIVRREIEVEIDEDVIEWIVEHGYSERYGARYLARQIEKTITYPLAQQLIRNDPPPGSALRLFIHNGRVASALVLPTTDLEVEEAAPAAALLDASQLPPRLTLSYMQAGLPLLDGRITALEQAHNISESRNHLTDLLQTMSTASFWDDTQAIQPQLEAVGRISSQVELIDGLRRNLDELGDYLKLMEESDDSSLLGEAAMRYRYLVRELPGAELTLLFSDPHDINGAYLHIEGRGNRAVAFDWAVELAQMYSGWAERRQFPMTVIAEELTHKGATRGVWLGIDGYGAYGLLRGDMGTHRLVQSVDEGKRQVVQARVSIWPDLPLVDQPESIRSESVQPDFRIKEISRSGIFSKRLVSQAELQLADDRATLKLSSALPATDLANDLAGLFRSFEAVSKHPDQLPSDPIWGQVVRSYVRYKKRYVQDPRTGLKSGKLKAILKGDIDSFLEAYLRQLASHVQEDG